MFDINVNNYFFGVDFDFIFFLVGKNFVYLFLENISIDGDNLIDKCGWIINYLVVDD